jgi:hypothetical protein
MSIISVCESDNSDALYKRYASLASMYLDSPDMLKQPSTLIPLENIYRLLEMYRYDAFSDESRAGILAISTAEKHASIPSTDKPWQENVVNALNSATEKSYSGKEEAVNDLEETLRLLSANKKIETAGVSRAKEFFSKFIEGLD